MRHKSGRRNPNITFQLFTGMAAATLFLLIWAQAAQVLAAPPSQSPPQGDASLGKNLFTGTARFSNEGPPCMACHSIAGMGALGGGVLGSDLTGAYSKLGSALITWPENVPPMRTVFSTKALTADEKANLLAFFQSAAVAQRPASSVGLLAVIGLAGAAALMLLASLFWRDRLRGVRRPLVARSKGLIAVNPSRR